MAFMKRWSSWERAVSLIGQNIYTGALITTFRVIFQLLLPKITEGKPEKTFFKEKVINKDMWKGVVKNPKFLL